MIVTTRELGYTGGVFVLCTRVAAPHCQSGRQNHSKHQCHLRKVKVCQSFIGKLKGDLRTLYGFLRKLYGFSSESNLWKLYSFLRKLVRAKLIFVK